MERFNDTSTDTHAKPAIKRDLWRLLALLALGIIAICAIISTIALGKISERIENLYDVTAKPHCYLSPNDPRRREIERNWGTDPKTEGACDAVAKAGNI